jgi:hypothetical protein
MKLKDLLQLISNDNYVVLMEYPHNHTTVITKPYSKEILNTTILEISADFDYEGSYIKIWIDTNYSLIKNS